jgi:hypothetical protein
MAGHGGTPGHAKGSAGSKRNALELLAARTAHLGVKGKLPGLKM